MTAAGRRRARPGRARPRAPPRGDGGHALLHRAPEVRGGRAACRTGWTRASASSAPTSPGHATGPRRGPSRSTSFKAGDLVRVTLTLRLHQGAALRRRHRSAARRVRARRVLVRDHRLRPRARPGRAGRPRATTGPSGRRAAASTASSATTTACCSSPPGSPRASTSSPTSRAPPPRAPSGPRPRTPRRCTSRRSSAAPAPPWSRCSREAAAAPRRPRSALAAALGAGLDPAAGPCPPGMLDLDDARLDGGRRPRRRAPARVALRRRPAQPAASIADQLPDDARARHPGRGGRALLPPPGHRPRSALARAVWHDVRARRMVEGGSTLTQQTVKVLIRPRSHGGGQAARRRCSPCASSTASASARSSPST